MTRRAAVVVACLAGCGGDAPSLEELPRATIDSVCSFYARCRVYPDKQTCVESERWGSSPEYATLAEAVAEGRVVYNAEAAADCLGDVEDAECAATYPYYTTFPESIYRGFCDGVFEGTVPAGGACFIDAECETQWCTDHSFLCDPSRACCPGVCAERPRESVPVGGSCDWLECDTSGYCDGGTCLARGREGESCDDAQPSCVDGLVCSYDPRSGLAVCKGIAARGASCDPELDPDACASLTDYCDSVSSTCVPRKELGSPCEPRTWQCVPYAYCRSPESVCTLPEKLGETCDSPFDCFGDLACVDGVCVPPNPASACTP